MAAPLLVVTGPPGAGKSTVADLHEAFALAEVPSRHVLREPPDGPEAVADLVHEALAAGSLRHGDGG